MINPSRRERDEFLTALEEARRAAMAEGEDDAAAAAEVRTSAEPQRSSELLRAIDRMAGAIKSYISAGLLARLYADGASHSAPGEEPEPQSEPRHETEPTPPPPPPAPPKSEHEAVVDELHLTPNLTRDDLARIRREYAKLHHPDRVDPQQREEATRLMTIANSLIDEALRGKGGKAH